MDPVMSPNACTNPYPSRSQPITKKPSDHTHTHTPHTPTPKTGPGGRLWGPALRRARLLRLRPLLRGARGRPPRPAPAHRRRRAGRGRGPVSLRARALAPRADAPAAGGAGRGGAGAPGPAHTGAVAQAPQQPVREQRRGGALVAVVLRVLGFFLGGGFPPSGEGGKWERGGLEWAVWN